MALGLRLLAKLDAKADNPQKFMKDLAAWIERRYSDLLPQIKHATVEDRPAIFCQLHPAAEEVEFTLLDAGHLVVSASTSSAGPGYHIFLASMLKDLGREFQASWQTPENESGEYGDETGYFLSGDEQLAFDGMTTWLQRVAKLFFDGTLDPEDTGIALSLSPATYFESEQLAITPLGPRSREWMRRTAEDGANGRDFFAWWKPGLNAEYHLGRALNLMWTSVRWRPPVNEAEENVLKAAAGSLVEAYRLDASLSYPWAEWREILELASGDLPGGEILVGHEGGHPTIGYRRGNVTVTLAGRWRIRVPGSFSDFELNPRNDLYALDPPREIWFTPFALSAPQSAEQFESKVNKLRQSESTHFVEGNQYVATATVSKRTRKTGEEYFEMNTLNACPYAQAVLTLIYSQATDEDWAVETWKSLRPPPPPKE